MIFNFWAKSFVKIVNRSDFDKTKALEKQIELLELKRNISRIC